MTNPKNPRARLEEIRDNIAESITAICYCAGPTCSGCESNTANLFKLGWNQAMERAQVLVDELRSTIARFDAIKHTTLCIGGDQLHIDFNCKHCLARYGGDKAESALQKFYGEENDK